MHVIHTPFRLESVKEVNYLREKLFMQEQRIYYHIHRLRIPYAFHEEFYAEGMIALWQAYESYDASRGELDTHLNAALNFHFIDLIRKNKRASDAQISAREQLITDQETGNTMTRTNQLHIDPSGIQITDTQVWQQIKSRSEEHTSELQSRFDLVCRLLLEKKKTKTQREWRSTCSSSKLAAIWVASWSKSEASLSQSPMDAPAKTQQAYLAQEQSTPNG